MKVIRAKSAGFCWGVERAIQVARDQARGGERRVYTDGPLIHNKQMMDALSQEDVREVGDYQSQDELEIQEGMEKESVMVIRAHGISPQRRNYLKGLGMPFKDGTCPDVGVIAGKVRTHGQTCCLRYVLCVAYVIDGPLYQFLTNRQCPRIVPHNSSVIRLSGVFVPYYTRLSLICDP